MNTSDIGPFFKRRAEVFMILSCQIFMNFTEMSKYAILQGFNESCPHELFETFSVFSQYYFCLNKDTQIDFHEILTYANFKAYYFSNKQKLFSENLQLNFCP